MNFARTLPTRTWSIGVIPAYHADNNTVLFEGGGPAIGISGGISHTYDVDFGARYLLFVNGPDYIGVDVQWLVQERRRSYFSLIGGLHYWEFMGLDATGLFTYNPRYEISLTTGLDFDVSFSAVPNPRFWIPLNFGYNLNDKVFLFAEYCLPISERSWDIFSAGANFIMKKSRRRRWR